MQAVSENGFALDFATQELKGDREIVMQAVCKAGVALHFASEQLKADEEIMQRALAQSPHRLVGLWLSGPKSRDMAILSLRCNILRDSYSGRLLSAPQHGAIAPLGT